MPDLLERESALAELHALLEPVGGGSGRAALVAGPAGIGKSALLRAFLDQAPVRALVGSCDYLNIPQPLGPFDDIARGDTALEAAMDEGAASFRRELLQALEQGPPTVVAIEDLHWADQATLDLTQYLLRRLDDVPVLLVMTLRSGLTLDHPASRLLGSVPTDLIMRIDLEELSLSVVTELAADTGRDPIELYALTDGNPFLVTEILTNDASVPPTVADSVAARIGGLEPTAFETAMTLSVIPGEAEWELVETLFPGESAAIADLEVEGVIVSSDRGISFRHELLRLAVEERLTPSERRAMNQRVLGALLTESASPTRIAHHADRAGDVDTLLHYSRLAMEHASSAGAHTQALGHALSIIPHIESFDTRERAEMWEATSLEYWFNQNPAQALEAIQRAIDLWEALGEEVKLGAALNRASALHWSLANPEESTSLLEEAISVLESMPPTSELIEAYVARAQDLGLSSRIDEALIAVDRAIDLASSIDDEVVLARAQGAREIIRLAAGMPDEARVDGDQAIAVFRARNAQDDLSMQYSNRIAAEINTLQFEHLDEDIGIAREYAEEIDSVGFVTRLAMHTGRLHLLRGDWSQSDQDAELVLGHVNRGQARSTALTVKATLAGRRSDPSAVDALEEAIELVSPTDDIQRLGSVAAALAELVWLGHDLDLDFVRGTFALARRSGYLRYYSELAIWLRRLGEEAHHEGPAPRPHAAELAGDNAGAAEAWRQLGCPYQRALTLAFSEAEEGMRESIDIVESLGATATRDRIRQMMRDKGIPLGRRATRATRSNPAGLTPRQMEVLRLLAEELTNAEVAHRLFISPKTVDHHVSAILSKLGVANRHDAAALLPGLETDN